MKVVLLLSMVGALVLTTSVACNSSEVGENTNIRITSILEAPIMTEGAQVMVVSKLAMAAPSRES